MPGGVTITPAVAAELAILGTFRALLPGQQPPKAPPANEAPYRPQSWGATSLTMITVRSETLVRIPTQGGGSEGEIDPSTGFGISGGIGTAEHYEDHTKIYVFDAAFRVGHSQSVQTTEHPVQDGVSVTDHAYLRPAVINLEIGMSDSMDQFSPNMWTGSDSKSVSAFQTLDKFRRTRTLMTVTTRLKSYENMLITDIRVVDTFQTRHALRASVELKQIFVATTSIRRVVSARPDATTSVVKGVRQVRPVPQTIVDQHKLPSTVTGAPSADELQSKIGRIPGAGVWSSNPTFGLGR